VFLTLCSAQEETLVVINVDFKETCVVLSCLCNTSDTGRVPDFVVFFFRPATAFALPRLS